MNILTSELLWETLLTGVSFSIFLMAIMQKVKSLAILKNDTALWITNFALAFVIGIPFSVTFYYSDWNQANIVLSVWVSLLGFVGAPGIYEALKSQEIVNYSPKSRKELQAPAAIELSDFFDLKGIMGEENE